MWLGWLMLCGVELIRKKERRVSKIKFCDGFRVSKYVKNDSSCDYSFKKRE